MHGKPGVGLAPTAYSFQLIAVCRLSIQSLVPRPSSIGSIGSIGSLVPRPSSIVHRIHAAHSPPQVFRVFRGKKMSCVRQAAPSQLRISCFAKSSTSMLTLPGSE